MSTDDYRKQITWQFAVALLVTLGIHLWFPQWTIAAAFALAYFTVFFPHWLGDLEQDTNTVEEDTNSDALFQFAIGAALALIEMLHWYLRYRGEVPFSDVMFPTPDSPYDLRLIFLGWLLMFQAMLGKLRQLFTDDSYPDT